MDVADLKVFEAVARLGGMNRASAELHTVQSNVTSRVRNLEQELDTKLFIRHRNGVTLTAAGRRLLPFALRARRLLDEAKRAVRDDGTPSGPLTLGSLETTAAHRLPPIVASYGRLFPEVDIVLRTATNARLIEDVLADRIEGAFVCGPVTDKRLAHDVVFREELVVATATSVSRWESLVRNGELKIVVKPAGCSYRDRLEDVLARKGFAARRLEFGTLEAVLGCVEAGLGATLLPRTVVDPAERAGRVRTHRLGMADSEAETVFIRQRDACSSSAFNAFLDLVMRGGTLAVAAE
jgi:DNA-binding transcriptional LysR family regulator